MTENFQKTPLGRIQNKLAGSAELGGGLRGIAPPSPSFWDLFCKNFNK